MKFSTSFYLFHTRLSSIQMYGITVTTNLTFSFCQSLQSRAVGGLYRRQLVWLSNPRLQYSKSVSKAKHINDSARRRQWYTKHYVYFIVSFAKYNHFGGIFRGTESYIGFLWTMTTMNWLLIWRILFFAVLFS